MKRNEWVETNGIRFRDCIYERMEWCGACIYRVKRRTGQNVSVGSASEQRRDRGGMRKVCGDPRIAAINTAMAENGGWPTLSNGSIRIKIETEKKK